MESDIEIVWGGKDFGNVGLDRFYSSDRMSHAFNMMTLAGKNKANNISKIYS